MPVFAADTTSQNRASGEQQGKFDWFDDFVTPTAAGDRPSDVHAEFCSSAIEVVEVDGCGRGLRLNQKAQRGEPLLVERAVFESTNDLLTECQGASSAFAVHSAWEKLCDIKRRRLCALRTGRPDDNDDSHSGLRAGVAVPITEWCHGMAPVTCPSSLWLARVSRNNAMSCVRFAEAPDGLCSAESPGDNASVGLWAIGALVNHSCIPSCSRISYPGWLVLRACKPIQSGSMLTHAYIDVRCPVFVRRKQLQSAWGFWCQCERCQFEEAVWSNAREKAAIGVWQRFRAMLDRRQCDESELSSMVTDAKNIVDDAIERFLSQPANNCAGVGGSLRESILPAFGLSKKQRKAMFCQKLLDLPLQNEAVAALMRFQNLLLASLWVAPAFEYANGLRFSGRPDQSRQLLSQIVAVTHEILPCSTLDAAQVVRHFVCAAEALQPEKDVCALAAEAMNVVDAAYGGGLRTLEFVVNNGKQNMAGQGRALIDKALGALFQTQRISNVEVPPPSSMEPIDRKTMGPTDDVQHSHQIAGHGISVCQDAEHVVVEIANVSSPAGLQFLSSESEVLICGESLALPARINVESARTRWYRRRRVVVFTAKKLRECS